jgi:hypothetical protein
VAGHVGAAVAVRVKVGKVDAVVGGRHADGLGLDGALVSRAAKSFDGLLLAFRNGRRTRLLKRVESVKPG